MNHKKLHEEANSNLIPGWKYDADRSSATQLSAIYKLLDERLPAAPMTVIESAPAPVEDNLAARAFEDGEEQRFMCKYSVRDNLVVQYDEENEIFAFIGEEGINAVATEVNLRVEDAVLLARRILATNPGR